jgi:hypothetical protein
MESQPQRSDNQIEEEKSRKRKYSADEEALIDVHVKDGEEKHASILSKTIGYDKEHMATTDCEEC